MREASPVVVLGHTGLLGRALIEGFRAQGLGGVCGSASADMDLTQPGSADRLAAVVDRGTTLVMAAARRSESEDGVDAAGANVAMALTIARLLQRAAVRRCVYVSSAAVYRTGAAGLVREESPLAPESFYAIGKFAAEQLLQHAARQGGAALLIVRPCRMYGAGDARASYGPAHFLRAAVEGRPVELYGDGAELRDHLYVEDAARAICELARSAHHGVVNLATGQSLPFVRWLELVEAQIGQAVQRRERPRTRPRFDQRFDIRRLRQAVPTWRFTEPAEGLRRMHEAIVQRPEGVVAP